MKKFTIQNLTPFLFIINPLFPFITAWKNPSFSNLLPSIWIIITIGFAAISGYMFWQSKKKCQKDIDRVLRIFSEFRPETLAQDFESLNQQLSTDPFIGHFWSEFVETLIRIKDIEGKEQIFNSIDANYFFNEENLIFSRINLQFYKAVPGILTGLGILGTFLGLTFGLSQINLATSDVNVLKEGINGLLSGASMAFSTSVWGIGLSITFLFFKRLRLGSLSKSVAQLQITIDKLFIHKRPEAILSDVLWESKQQTLELRRFNEDLAISIAAALDEKLAARLTPTFEKLLTAIEELTKTGTSQVAKIIIEGAGKEIENLKGVLNKVGETLQHTVSQSQETQERVTGTFNDFLKTLGKQQDALNTSIQEAINTLISKIEATLSQQQEQIKDTTTRATEELLQSLSKFSNDVSNLVNKLGQETATISEEMRVQINELTNLMKERMEEVSKQHQTEQAQLKELLNQLNITLTQVENIVKEASLAAETFTQSAIPIKEANIRLFQAVQDIQKSHESFKETLHNTQDLLKHYSLSMKESVGHLLEASQKTQLAWRAYEDKFGQIKEDLEAVFEEIRKGLQDYTEITGRNVGEILGKFDQHLSEAIKYLGGAVERLQETQEEISEEIEQLRKLR